MDDTAWEIRASYDASAIAGDQVLEDSRGKALIHQKTNEECAVGPVEVARLLGIGQTKSIVDTSCSKKSSSSAAESSKQTTCFNECVGLKLM